MQYCSLQHQALLPSPVTSTPGYCFCMALSLHSFWNGFSTLLQQHTGHLPTWGVHLSSVISFCLFVLFMGFSGQEYWSGLPFPSPVDHILSELSTITCLSSVALHGMATCQGPALVDPENQKLGWSRSLGKDYLIKNIKRLGKNSVVENQWRKEAE